MGGQGAPCRWQSAFTLMVMQAGLPTTKHHAENTQTPQTPSHPSFAALPTPSPTQERNGTDTLLESCRRRFGIIGLIHFTYEKSEAQKRGSSHHIVSSWSGKTRTLCGQDPIQCVLWVPTGPMLALCCHCLATLGQKLCFLISWCASIAWAQGANKKYKTFLIIKNGNNSSIHQQMNG